MEFLICIQSTATFINSSVNVYCTIIKLHLNNSLKIHEENTKKITAVSVVLYVIKFHVNLHKL